MCALYFEQLGMYKTYPKWYIILNSTVQAVAVYMRSAVSRSCLPDHTLSYILPTYIRTYLLIYYIYLDRQGTADGRQMEFF